MASVGEHPHALVVPANALGHVNGCMLLARSLAVLGFKITFVYFSSYHAKLIKKKHVVVPASPHIEEAADPSYPNTTSHCDSGTGSGSGSGGGGGGDLTSDQTTTTTTDSFCSGTGIGSGERKIGRGMLRIHVIEDGTAPGDTSDMPFFVTPAMKENLSNFIRELQEQGVPPTCLISDVFLPWTLHVAESAGIPRINYWTSNAMSYLLLINIPSLFSQGIFPEKGSPTQWKSENPLMLNLPGLPPISSNLYIRDIRFADSSDPIILFFEEIVSCVKSVERILIHTMLELELDAFRAFQVLGIPAYAIGPLLHYAEEQEDTPASSQAKENSGSLSVSQSSEQLDCISWLNMQAEASVIYIAFGTFASLSVEEIQELSMGLEASGNPFLWVIREDSPGGAELPQVLPDGFLERTSVKGLIISWASQLEVLAHKAVGGFLTHCGWNSTFESMWMGVPMLCCPRMAEQMVNSHYICDVWGVGLELGRTDTGGLERSFVELGVKALMQDEEGLKARGKAQEVMQLARKTCQQGGQSFNSLQKFYDDMKILCSKHSSQTFSD